MHKATKLLLGGLVFATLASVQLSAQAKSEAKPQPAPPRLKVGDTAPDFFSSARHREALAKPRGWLLRVGWKQSG